VTTERFRSSTSVS